MPPRYSLPESESESEPDQSETASQPSDKELEKALRDVVARIYKTGNMEELTVKRVRLAAEKSLQLEMGFYKTNGDWKTRSDQIIKDEVEVQDAAGQESKADDEEEDRASTPPSDTVNSTKRAKPKLSSAPRKRRKTSIESEAASGLDDEESEEATKPAKRQPKAPAKKKTQPEPSEEKVIDDSGAEQQGSNSPEKNKKAGGDSESEMSVVLDEESQPKRQRQKKSTGAASEKPKKKAPAKGKNADADPNQAEIKRLQGWLIKCGMRKIWSRELAPYDTPKAKIEHLKNMLKEVGMEGRYSVEKARQIKEERELREDLEMVQEGAKRWGKAGAEDASDGGQPRRRLNRGLKSLAFLESEGEESD
ncbi:transcriptional regulator [Aspergillus cavernicola]|uniref:Transcriptional regulator n=1 Tax=Aspergillus cavernicola TaxID=176166 RepID=A0ABR4J671_9EURO